MIIVVKIDVVKSESSIVDIIDGVHELDIIRGYHSLLQDTLELDRAYYSIKNISKIRTEVYKKNMIGQSYLEYVYEIHESKDIEPASEEE